MKGRGIGTARGRATIMRGTSLGHTAKEAANYGCPFFSKWCVYGTNPWTVWYHTDYVIFI